MRVEGQCCILLYILILGCDMHGEANHIKEHSSGVYAEHYRRVDCNLVWFAS